MERETFLSALELTLQLLRGLGLKPDEAKRLIATFKQHDENRLYHDYEHHTDHEKMRVNAQTAAVELEDLFAQDVEDLEGEDEADNDTRRDTRRDAQRSSD